jgi:hypothetical protein
MYEYNGQWSVTWLGTYLKTAVNVFNISYDKWESSYWNIYMVFVYFFNFGSFKAYISYSKLLFQNYQPSWVGTEEMLSSSSIAASDPILFSTIHNKNSFESKGQLANTYYIFSPQYFCTESSTKEMLS